MKKIISCIIAVLVLAGAAFYTVTADKSEGNLCLTFDDELNVIYSVRTLGDFSDLTASEIAYFTAWQYVEQESDQLYYSYKEGTKEYYPSKSSDDFQEGNYIKVNADKFDETVKKCFNYKGNFREEFITEINYGDNTLDNYYNEAENYYIVSWPKIYAQGVPFIFAGYVKSETGYKAYIKGVNDDDSEIKENENPFYAEFDIKYNGGYLKVNDFKTVKAVMPEIDGLITYPDFVYKAPNGMTVDGEDCFNSKTAVEITENSEDDYDFNLSKIALKDISADGKISVLNIRAYKTGTWCKDLIQPSKPVKITFDIPKGLSADNLKMFYILDDGKTEEVKITVDKVNNKVTAELNHFSVYAFCNVKSNTVNGGTNNNTAGSNTELKSPKTGYNSGLLAVLMLASLSVISVSAIKISKEF